MPMRRTDLLWLVPCVALGLALLDWPYGYYRALRLGIFVIAGVFAFVSSTDEEGVPWVWTFCAVAFIYNPVMPLHLGREAWTVVNLATVGVFAWHWYSVEWTARRK
jgi:hypothetical protein